MKTSLMVPAAIEQKILLIRGEKVMLDFHLADLYGVETKVLKRAVKRNSDRFPADFCFELSVAEMENLRYQFGTSSWGGRRYAAYAFTEQGVAMLSSVLKSKGEVRVNIEVMPRRDSFATGIRPLREILSKHEDLAKFMATSSDRMPQIQPSGSCSTVPFPLYCSRT